MVAALWLGMVAMLSLSAVAAALVAPGTFWSTRATPRDVFRVGTGVAFSAWVHPSLGLLAGLGALWWWRQGWMAAAGATFWPLVAGAIWLGLMAPAWAMHAGVALLLAVGVVQVILGVAQASGLPLFRHPDMIHGTIGHRTGYGIFLALLVPLAFLSEAGPWLAAVYAVGILLSFSSVAAGAALVGMVTVLPSSWLPATALAVLGIGVRVFKLQPGKPPGFAFRLWPSRRWVNTRHVGQSVQNRRLILVATVSHMRGWRDWLVGHGPEAFTHQAHGWIADTNLREHFREAHNDYVEGLYDYGLLGVAAGLLWVLTQPFRIGDPVTGSLAAFGVAMLANFPLRVATTATVALVCVILLMRRSHGWAW